MSKGKSIFVTALVAVMLAAIIIGLYLLKNRAYLIIAGLLGLYGFLCAAFNFCQWLGKEPPLLPPPQKLEAKAAHQEPDEFWPPDPDWTESFDRIKAELEDSPPQVESTHEIMGYEK